MPHYYNLLIWNILIKVDQVIRIYRGVYSQVYRCSFNSLRGMGGDIPW